MNILVDKEFKALIPPLQPEEFAQLEANILADGCRDPLVVWPSPTHSVELDDGEVVTLCYEDRVYDEVIGHHDDGEGFHYWKIEGSEESIFDDEWPIVLVDGHNRHEICTKHDLPFDVVRQAFESKAHARVWMRNNQKGRRNLPKAWEIELGLGIKDDLAAIGAARRKETEGRPTKETVITNDSSIKKHNTQKEIAQSAGVSTGLVAQAEIVKAKAPDLWEKAKAQEITIGAAYKEIKNEEKKQERAELIQKQRDDIEQGTVALPVGVFEVIAIDPPWNYGREYDPETSRVANPYPEMTQAQLLELSPPFADDSVLFLWTTHQFIWDAKQLMDKWGFTYKANVVWDKEKIGMGAWVRMQCEFCLVGIKGKPTWDNTTWRDIIRESRREHSRKPDAFYQMVEEVTVGRRLEYFSREQRKGWEVFGNDTQKF